MCLIVGREGKEYFVDLYHDPREDELDGTKGFDTAMGLKDACHQRMEKANLLSFMGEQVAQERKFSLCAIVCQFAH